MKFLLFILIITQLINISLFSQIDTNNKNNTFLNKDKDLIKDKLLKYENIIYGSYIETDDDENLFFVVKDNDGNYILVGNSYASIKTVNSKISNKNSGSSDLFIYKLDNNFKIIWATMYGGSFVESPNDIGIDKNNNIWICGETSSKDIPRTRQKPNISKGNMDAFICCISPDGSLKFSEIFSSNGYDAFNQLAIDDIGNCYVGGRSFNDGFDVSADSKFPKKYTQGYNGVIAMIKTNGDVYSSYLMDKPTVDYFIEAIDVDSQGNIIVSGHTNNKNHQTKYANLNNQFSGGELDIFIQKYDNNLNLIWDNLFGGNGIDKISSLKVGENNNIYFLLITNSNNLPVVNSLQRVYKGNFDPYILKTDSAGNIIWSTYIGSSNFDGLGTNGGLFDRNGAGLYCHNEKIGVNFTTFGSDLPISEDSFQKQIKTNTHSDSYSIILEANGEINYSTYYGSIFNEWTKSIWFDDNEIIINGGTSSDLIVTDNAIDKYKVDGSTAGFILVLKNKEIVVDKTPPSITSQSADDCGNTIEYFINDDNNPFGYKNINIIKNDNCSVVTVIKDRILNVTISKNSLDKNAYYKIEITNQADKKLIIEDSLLANSANLIRTEPANFLDLGKLSVFNNQYCQDIKIFNDSDNEFTITDSYFKNYKYFSFSLSQIPFTLAPKSNKDFTVCVSPQDMKQSLINDTLVLIADCFFKELPVVAEYYIPNLNSDSKCDVYLEVVPDSANSFNYQSIVSHNNEILIETNSKAIQSVEFFDLYSAKINEVDIDSKPNMIRIDFNNLANSTYFVYFKEEKSINIIKIYLMR